MAQVRLSRFAGVSSVHSGEQLDVSDELRLRWSWLRNVAIFLHAIPKIRLTVATAAHGSRAIVGIDEIGIVHAAFGSFGSWSGQSACRQ